MRLYYSSTIHSKIALLMDMRYCFRRLWPALLLLLVQQSVLAIGADELLDPEIAFAISAYQDGEHLQVQYNIAPGYYLYRHSFKFTSNDKNARLGTAQIPAGEKHEDEFFGEVETYRNLLEISVPFQANAPLETIQLQATSQGCADVGVCYPPITQTVLIPISAAPQSTKQTAPASYTSEQDRIAHSLTQGKLWLILTSFFGFGLLLAFTPCVFPMIPILSGIIAGQGEQLSTRKAFLLSLIYVLAMAFTYTIAGVIVGLSGENVQALFQNVWVLGAFALVFVLLSLSMFGFYDLQMPSALQNKLTQISNSQQGGTLLGAAIMGLLSALIVGPCVTAPLIGALIYIADSGDAVLGGVALFALSLGMGAPLIAIGTSAGKLLPKTGAWMDVIKKIFGILLLAVAIWLLERVLPFTAIMLLCALLLIPSGFYFFSFKHPVIKALGFILLLYGALLIIGLGTGKGSPMQPLQGLTGGTHATSEQHLSFQNIKGQPGLQQALQQAAQSGQPAMLDFYADWCISCKEMEAFTFTDTRVQTALSGFMRLQTDVTANDAQDKALLKAFGLFGPPAILFFDTQQNELRQLRVVGYLPAEDFLTHIQQVNLHFQ